MIAQRVANEVERQNRQHDCNRRIEDYVRRIEQVRASLIQHGSPTGRRRRNTQAQKAECCFSKDGPSHADGSLHSHRLQDVGKNVPEQDANIRSTQCSRRFHKLTAPHL